MIRRILATLTVVLALVFGTSLAAWAHVTVEPGTAPKGGADQELTFRVPNEDDKADVIKVDMEIPTDHPLLGLEAAAMPGWTIEPITTDDGTITEAASEVIWSGGSIPPGRYGDFRLIVGQLPSDVTQVKFPIIQSYTGSKDVSWIDDTPPGGAEPEHPAPVLALTSAKGDGAKGDSAQGGDTAATGATTAPDVAVTATSSTKVDSANSKATIAIVIAVVGVIAGAGAILLGRKRNVSRT
jgi:uncharacterized protein YcnI